MRAHGWRLGQRITVTPPATADRRRGAACRGWRLGWALFAYSAGVNPAARVPVVLVPAAVPVTLATAVLIAARPGWEAARVQPAILLRRD